MNAVIEELYYIRVVVYIVVYNNLVLKVANAITTWVVQVGELAHIIFIY